MSNLKWERQQQEQSGSYMFSGQLYITSGIQVQLSKEEISWIVNDVKEFVNQSNGIDYLVVYQHQKTKQKLFFIDQLNRDMIASGQYKLEYNYATLMLPEEY